MTHDKSRWRIPERWRSILTWIIRLLTGGVFIFSGFVKAIDPWGTLYKVEDYLGAMGLDIWPNLVISGVFFLCALEFLLGVFLILGCFRRATPIGVFAVMCFMLPLTLWIALGDPVPDCGCFGDALKLTNWETFWKNVVLTAFSVWLLPFNKRMGWLIAPALQWIALVTTAVFIIGVSFLGYSYQPLIDFRPYAEGATLFESDMANADESAYVFTYEKDGVKKDFRDDEEMPDEADGWKFVDRKEVAADTPHSEADVHKDFRIWDDNGDEDITEDIAEDGNERKLFILMPDLSGVSIASSYKINSLYTWALKHDIEMMAVVAGDLTEINKWRDLSMAEYPIYTADDTAIKEVVRGNPAVVYVSQDTVRWKSTLKTIDVDDFLAPDISADPMSFARDNREILRNISMLYLAVMVVQIVSSFLPRLNNIYKFREKKNKRG